MEHLSRFVGQMSLIDDSRAEGIISSEYSNIRDRTSIIKKDLGLTTKAGALKDNVKKNRYKDILPYDQTRVPLTLLTNDNDSDYINASFIKGATETRKYIATQGPLRHTLVDFWQMIWQYDVKVIIMACREIEMGKKKCERYWTTVKEKNPFGPFIVSNLEESNPNEEVVLRTLTVRYQNETRTISQFQYTAWPDHDIPYTAGGILEMMDMARKAQGNNTSPVLIHCRWAPEWRRGLRHCISMPGASLHTLHTHGSIPGCITTGRYWESHGAAHNWPSIVSVWPGAGCGRTGVICALDYVHDLLVTKQIKGDFNIMKIVVELRRQRPSAVQTKEQYQFVFSAVAYMFEKALRSPENNYQNLTKSNQPLYDDVESVKTSPPITSAIAQPLEKRNSSVQPRAPQLYQQNMDDTYAVVNKSKQLPSPASSSAPPAALHHYDNAELGTLKCPATALYSTVKPKSRCPPANPPPAASPIYDTARPANHRLAEDVLGKEQSGYEQVTAERHSSMDDDYEYVSNPIKDLTNSCTPGSMGFNCRIKKPKGPRDTPAEWSHVER
ncbi:tyrosine-protein phosphatase non-receptor type 18 isoform X1 [Salvelinus fontinalis]|uniref:tyrosine-protein phosphatase non-receptor type 18 isoform X1 n=1 Tax=Salvelinus fontinalis TaxID=8038 RepID=UPI002484E95B|nr:tyrosine-protein phosphatase non-receptor type 18 isoform X1 [Salvelinus fontinalis]